MNYVDFTVGDNNYKLRLNTRNVVALEKLLGCNPLMIFGTGDKIPTVTNMVQILYSSLQQYQHSITLDKAYDIFDEYLSEDHIPTDFIAVIIDVYKASGIMKADHKEEEESESEKNA